MMARNLGILLFAAVVSCAGGHGAAHVDKTTPGTCSSDRPVTEPDLMAWDATSRSELTRLRQEGVAAVQLTVDGCEVRLRLLSHCIGKKGKYSFSPYAKTDSKEATTADELYARLPLGASRFAAELKGDREIRADSIMVGQYSLPASTSYAGTDLEGPDCSLATHVVSTIFIGGFTLAEGSRQTLSGEATLFSAGAGASRGNESHVLEQEGDPDTCELAKKEGTAKPGCSAPLRLSLLALDAANKNAGSDAPQPQTAAPSCPNGMAGLPGGRYTLGYRGDNVTVAPFCMDLTEVTELQYLACIQAGGCTADHLRESTPHAEDDALVPEPKCNYAAEGKANHPINCVDWVQADTYCKAQGKRLPSEEEWEWAARGGAAGLKYPWGAAEPDAYRMCGSPKGSEHVETCPVGSFPGGDAPGGFHDLAGNVWEWTTSNGAPASWNSPSKAHIYRGGGFHSGAYMLITLEAICGWEMARQGEIRSCRAPDLGFRCVQSAASPSPGP